MRTVVSSIWEAQEPSCSFQGFWRYFLQAVGMPRPQVEVTEGANAANPASGTTRCRQFQTPKGPSTQISKSYCEYGIWDVILPYLGTWILWSVLGRSWFLFFYRGFEGFARLKSEASLVEPHGSVEWAVSGNEVTDYTEMATCEFLVNVGFNCCFVF